MNPNTANFKATCLNKLTDAQLLLDAKKWADHERAGLHGVLHHLYEIDRRRLFAQLKYSSLFAYVTTELKYSDDAAIHRISAMRLMKELPEIESKIAEGALSLTNLSLAKKLFRKKTHSKQQKMAVLKRIEAKSTREAQKIVYEILPEMKKREVGYSDFDDDLKAKLERVRGMLAHKEGDLSLTQLLHRLCDDKLSAPAAPRVLAKVPPKHRCCTNCGSVHALEVDHILPKALGGTDESENLRILCRSCNQRAAIVYFGATKMQRHIRSDLKG